MFGLMVIWIKPIGRKLFNVSLGQPSEFGLSQALSEVQEGLWEKTLATTKRSVCIQNTYKQ